MVLGGSWAPSGRGLGLSGPSCGRSWGLLGRLLGVQIQALCEDCSNMGSKRPSGSILGPSGEGFGRFWGEFESIFGWIFRKFEHNLDTAAT